MYLTRFAVNPARRGSRKLLSSPHALHAAILSGFPPDLGHPDPTLEGRVLWRLDRGLDHSTLLYISSPTPPDLTHLVEQAGWPTTQAWETRDYEPMLSRLEAGQRWAFRLTANPVRHVRTQDSDAKTKPRGHVTADQQLGWLLSRTATLGIDVHPPQEESPAVLVSDRRTTRFGRNGSTVTLVTATFDGRLHVTDASLLRQALVNGVGRAKGYGCGMLTLAPL